MNQAQKKYITRVDVLVIKGQEELLSDSIYALAGKGFWLENQGEHVLLKCYPENPDELLNKLSSSGLDIAQVHVEKELPKDYAELTKKYFRPIRIGDLTIRSPWNRKRGNSQEIIIDPGMAFGTGRHESTRIMIKLMADIDFGGKNVLDVGCGSGILALYAHTRGAKKIFAIDNDPDAVFNAQKNAELNKADALHIACANLQDIIGTFDIVLANIDIRTFSESSENIARLVVDNGFLFVSGVLNKNKDRLLQLFESWEIIRFFQKNSWCGFHFHKKINNPIT